MTEETIVGRAFIRGELVDNVVVEIRDGRITRVEIGGRVKTSRVSRLSRGEILLPSATDLHVHLRDWEQGYKEDITSGTCSAAAGGVTTVAEMPNTIPPINSVGRLRERLELLREKAVVDYAIHVGALNSVGECVEAKQLGACAMKLYPNDLNKLGDYLEFSRESGLRLAIHAEFKGGDEPEAVRYVLQHLSPVDDVRFVHVSRKESVEMIKGKRKSFNGVISVEVTPHHILLSQENLSEKVRKFGVVKPPLADEECRRAVYEALRRSVVDFIATDHAPHTIGEKLSDDPAPGFPGLEIVYPLMLTEWLEGRISLNAIIEKLCYNPARYLGIKKGAIEKGYYADLVIFRIDKWSEIDPGKFFSRAKYTVFEGWRIKAQVVATYLRGEKVYEDNQVVRRGGKHITEIK